MRSGQGDEVLVRAPSLSILRPRSRYHDTTLDAKGQRGVLPPPRPHALHPPPAAPSSKALSTLVCPCQALSVLGRPFGGLSFASHSHAPGPPHGCATSRRPPSPVACRFRLEGLSQVPPEAGRAAGTSTAHLHSYPYPHTFASALPPSNRRYVRTLPPPN